MIKIQQKIGTIFKKPFVGSGKITRRINVSKVYKRKSYDPVKLKNRMDLKREIKTKKIDFKNTKVKKIFMHWNTKGRPFTVHQLKQGIMVSLAINKAYRATKKHRLEEIIDCIDLCHKTFSSSWFKFQLKRPGIYRLQLCDFFEFRQDKINEIKRNNKPLFDVGIKSWFEECLKGEKYLNKKYSVYTKDKNPHLTKRLKEIWEEYDEAKIKSSRDVNLITSCCNKAVAFADLNNKLGFNPMEIISTIDRMINQFKDFKPKHLGYLTNEIFWSRQLPKELVRFGTVLKTDRNRIKLLNRK